MYILPEIGRRVAVHSRLLQRLVSYNESEKTVSELDCSLQAELNLCCECPINLWSAQKVPTSFLHGLRDGRSLLIHN